MILKPLKHDTLAKISLEKRGDIVLEYSALPEHARLSILSIMSQLENKKGKISHKIKFYRGKRETAIATKDGGYVILLANENQDMGKLSSQDSFAEFFINYIKNEGRNVGIVYNETSPEMAGSVYSIMPGKARLINMYILYRTQRAILREDQQKNLDK